MPVRFCDGLAGPKLAQREAAHRDVSMKMAELSLLPAMRAASAGTLLVAGGTSCRHQIKDGTDSGNGERDALHVAPVPERALG